MRIDAYASLPHYWRHIRPIFEALPDGVRGEAYDETTPLPNAWDYVLCAGWADTWNGGKVIYVEHGAGQTYSELQFGGGSYAGGEGLGDVRLFITPSVRVSDQWLSSGHYPSAKAVAVGCPKMDRYIRGPRPQDNLVVVAFHWDCTLLPETRSAFEFWSEHMEELVSWCGKVGLEVAGHAHPRWNQTVMRRFWNRLGCAYFEHEADVFELGTVLIADNTSLAYEFASLDRPVIALNAPWYRRDVVHGLRFWSHVPGPQADSIEQLLDLLASTNPLAHQGPSLVPYVYEYIDGHATNRAVLAILKEVSSV